MTFGFYNRLTLAQKRTYQKSDGITSIPLKRIEPLHSLIDQLESALKKEDRELTQYYSQKLLNAMTDRLRAPRAEIDILENRPTNHSGELQGLYLPEEGKTHARIKIWMRTAKRKQVVAFKTFLRTILHELCHHMDYEVFGLSDTFHTEGFYKRESSLLHQLLRTPNARAVSVHKSTIKGKKL